MAAADRDARDLARRVEARLLSGMDRAGRVLRHEGPPGTAPLLRHGSPAGTAPLQASDTLLVACSGGPDSLALLHLLRFGLGFGVDSSRPGLEAAHLDHDMRPDSSTDGRWLQGVCAAWGVPLHTARLDPPARTETEARTRRYRWLESVRESRECPWIVTAHHADDQIETVLFRAVRGTGIEGLRGMDAWTDTSILRPLLAEPRTLVARWARLHGLGSRTDPSNQSLEPSRNRIRLEVLPSLDRVHPGSRRALLRLSRRARDHRDALDHLLEGALEDVVEEAGAQHVVVARRALRAYPLPVRGELLRAVLGRLGVRLGETATDGVIEFVSSGTPEGRLDLPASTTLLLNPKQVRIERRAPTRTSSTGPDGASMSTSTPEGVARRVGVESFQRVVFSEEEIRRRVRAMGAEITRHYDPDEPLLVLGLLKGSFIFLADLVRTIQLPLQVDFLVASSYGSGKVSSGKLQLLYDPDTSFRDRNVLLVEDIVDSGNTLDRLVPILRRRQPRSLEICALLHKRLTTMETEARWVGFDCPSEFVVGYGLDHAENFRHLPFIGSL